MKYNLRLFIGICIFMFGVFLLGALTATAALLKIYPQDALLDFAIPLGMILIGARIIPKNKIRSSTSNI